MKGENGNAISSEMDKKEAIEMAKFYIVSGQYSRAKELLQDIISKDPDNTDAMFNLGILYELTNDLDRAIDMFRNLLELDPENREAERHLSKLLEM